MAIVGFDQDPEAPAGAGLFHFDDRPSLWAHSPRDAAPFMQPPAPEPDQRLAMSDPGAVYSSPAWQQAQGGDHRETAYLAPESLQSRADFAPDMSGGMSPASMPPEPARPAPIAPQPVAPKPSPQPMRSAPVQVTPQMQATAPQGPDALRAPKGTALQSVTVEGAGRPYDQREAEARGELALNREMVEKQIVDRQARDEEAQAIAAGKQADELRKAAAEKQQQYDKAKADFTSKRADIEKEVDAAASRKIDPNHYFENKSTFSRVMMAVSQALGAFSAGIGQHPNYAQQQIDKAVEADIAAQQENIKLEGTKANNKLARLMKDYDLDMGEASAILRNSQQKLLDTQALALAHATKSKDIMDSWDRGFADRMIGRQKTEEDLKERAAGKMVAKFNSTAGGGGGSQLDRWAQGLGYPTYNALVAIDSAKRRANPEHTWDDTIREASQAMKGKGGEGQQQGGLGQRLATAVSKGELFDNRGRELGKMLGAEFDEKSGRFKVPAGVGGFIGGKARGALNAGEEALGLAGARPTVRTQAVAALSTVLAAGQGRSHETDEEAASILNTNDPRAIAQRLNQAFDEKDAFEKAAYKHGSKSGRIREELEDE